ncbi:uncharacterized protein [Dermacentor albipictus]|uniref:uncharacterized protein n=1 Tax=Dermacentor albipictus TaxID=60249 RepID=UPI0038FCE1B9
MARGWGHAPTRSCTGAALSLSSVQPEDGRDSLAVPRQPRNHFRSPATFAERSVHGAALVSGVLVASCSRTTPRLGSRWLRYALSATCLAQRRVFCSTPSKRPSFFGAALVTGLPSEAWGDVCLEELTQPHAPGFYVAVFALGPDVISAPWDRTEKPLSLPRSEKDASWSMVTKATVESAQTEVAVKLADTGEGEAGR